MGRYYDLVYKLVIQSFDVGINDRGVVSSYFEFFETMLKCEFISKMKYMLPFWSIVLDHTTKYLISHIDAEDEEM